MTRDARLPLTLVKSWWELFGVLVGISLIFVRMSIKSCQEGINRKIEGSSAWLDFLLKQTPSRPKVQNNANKLLQFRRLLWKIVGIDRALVYYPDYFAGWIRKHNHIHFGFETFLFPFGLLLWSICFKRRLLAF